MMSWAGLLGGAFGSVPTAGLREIAEGSPLLSSPYSRAGAKAALEIQGNPGNVGISLGSGVSSYSEALKNGAGLDQAVANGIYKGLTEYFSNKLFSGTPFEDTEKGYVTQLIEHAADRIGKSGALAAFNRTSGGRALNWFADKAGEGMEELVTGIADPLIDRLTYDREADLATAEELADEFLGGVLLSLLMSGGEAAMNGFRSRRQAEERLTELGLPKEEARRYAPELAKAGAAIAEMKQWQPGLTVGTASATLKQERQEGNYGREQQTKAFDDAGRNSFRERAEAAARQGADGG